MSDQERNHSANSDLLGEIDWTHYGRQAQSIREGVLQEVEQQPSDSQQPDQTEPATESAEAYEETPAEVYSEEVAEEYAEEVYDGEEEQEDQLTEEEARQAYEEDYTPRRRPLVPPEPPQPPEQPKPAQKKRRRVRSAGVTFLVALLYVVSVLSIAFVTATLGWKWANDLLALNKEERTASVTIQAGDGVDEVAQKLKDNGLIEYPFLFEIFAGFTNKAEKISSGTYELNTNMDYSALLNNISASSKARETVTVTIPEGYTVEEIFQLLEKQGACTVEQLKQSALNDEFNYPFLRDLERGDNPYWMEGYLFPDTYEFYKDGDAKLVLAKMLWNYSNKFTDEMKTRAERLGYSQHEIMIIASIIEKETDGRDQRDIASVIYNRLQPDNNETLGKLQMDSTIQYILEERKERLTEEDLKIDSTYNTYLYEGLPSGTICNPGMEAIEAALYPNTTTYYYFILGNDGVTHFFSSYSDFNDFRNGIPVEPEEEDEDFLTLDDELEDQENQ
ncbi:MAG: endolytic transglycosylase MltG [Candidatus Onthomonas sp.]